MFVHEHALYECARGHGVAHSFDDGCCSEWGVGVEIVLCVFILGCFVLVISRAYPARIVLNMHRCR